LAAEDVADLEDGTFEVVSEPIDAEAASTALPEGGCEVTNDSVPWVADQHVAVTGSDARQMPPRERQRWPGQNCSRGRPRAISANAGVEAV
jgi:hypothetical protein